MVFRNTYNNAMGSPYLSSDRKIRVDLTVDINMKLVYGVQSDFTLGAIKNFEFELILKAFLFTSWTALAKTGQSSFIVVFKILFAR